MLIVQARLWLNFFLSVLIVRCDTRLATETKAELLYVQGWPNLLIKYRWMNELNIVVYLKYPWIGRL